MKTTPRYESAMQIGFISGLQPYDENRVNRLIIVVKNGPGVEGSMVKLNSFYLYVPEKISMFEDESCSFENLGGDDKGHIVYGLKNEVYKKYNVDCEEIAKEKNLEYGQCLLYYKQLLTFGCDFKIIDVNEFQEYPEYSVFTAKADYEFNVVGRTNVNIVRDGIGDERVA